MSDFVTPPPLEPGDEVAIVAPSSGLAAAFPHVYELGLERLRSVFGLEPVEFPTATKPDDYLRAHPEERAADVEAAFEDPEVRGVIATIGGNDQIRILEHLDPATLREHPTRFYGSSDNANLAHVLWNEGIVSYYGGDLMTDFAVPGSLPEYQESALETALFEESIGEVDPAPRFTDQDLDWAEPENLEERPETEPNPGWTWRGGDDPVEGRTWGGSLEITHLQVAADRYLPPPGALDGGVLLLETSEELPSPEAVYRMLLGMGERGLLSRFDGFLVGRIKARSPDVDRPPAEREAYRERLRDVVTDVVADYNSTAPVVFGVDFGHTQPIVPLPLGATVSIDPKEERLVFE